MITERTYDSAVIKDILSSFLDRISEDGATLTIDPEKEAWVLMKNPEIVGIYCLHPLNSTTLQIHAHVIDRDVSHETGEAILKWFLDECEYDKIVAEIPKLYPEVYRFTKKFGFLDEGVNRLSYRKAGILWDTWYLGITRDEIIGYFEGINQGIYALSD